MSEHKHSVINGELLKVSPSQVKNFDEEQGGCRRAWWYDKVAHLPRKQIAAQVVGTTTHAQLEHYLETGEDVLGPIARAGKGFLPAPGPDLLIEYPVHYLPPDGPCRECGQPYTAPGAEACRKWHEREQTRAIMCADDPKLYAAGIPMIGFIDLINPRTVSAGRVRVTDHKTTSSIARYAKTEKQLRKDPQCATYCQFSRLKFPRVDRFDFEHIYYQTKGARYSEPVCAALDLTGLTVAWDKTCATVELMRAAAREKDPARIPCNREACDAYGGCSFAGTCNDSPSRRFTLGLMDRLKAKTTGTPAPVDGGKLTQDGAGNLTSQAPAAAAPAPAQAAPAQATPPPAPVAQAPPAPAAPAAPAPAAGGIPASSCVAGEVYALPDGTFGEFAGAAGKWSLFKVNDTIKRVLGTDRVHTLDDAPAPAAAAPAAAATPAPAAVLPPDAPKSDPAKAAEPAPAAPVAEQAPAAPAAEEKPKRKPRAKAEEPAPAAAPSTPPAAPAAQATRPLDVDAQIADGLALFVGCVPNVPARDLSSYVADLAAKAAQVAGVEDVRIADRGAGDALAFGKWRGYLAALARENPPTGACVIWPSDLADPVIEALAPLASLVVRGR